MGLHPIESSIYSDMRNYLQVADQILGGEWKVTHFFQPIGLPLLIAGLKSWTSNWSHWLEGIHILSAAGTLYLMWRTSSECFGEKNGLLTTALAAIHVPWVIFSGLALAECLFIFTLALLAWFSLRLVKSFTSVNATGWALAFLLAYILKGTHIFMAPLFLVGLLWWKKKNAFKNSIIIASIIWTGFFAHGFFTQTKIGKFQLSASAGGLNFVEGKCPIKNNADSAGYSWLSPLYFQQGMTEQKRWDRPFTDSSFFMQEGWKCIKQNPLVLVQSLENIPFLFIGNFMWPSNDFRPAPWIRLYEMLISIFLISGFALFISLKKTQEEWLVWMIPPLSLFVCVYIFKSEIRFRVPFDVWLIPIAMSGWTRFLKMRRQLQPPVTNLQ
jgi:hypothetical protein